MTARGERAAKREGAGRATTAALLASILPWGESELRLVNLETGQTAQTCTRARAETLGQI